MFKEYIIRFCNTTYISSHPLTAVFCDILATCLCNNRVLRSKDEGLWRPKCAQKLLWVFNVKTQGASSCRKQETKLSIFRCVGVGIRGG